MKAVAYVRVSTEKEEQELSLQNQQDFFEKYIVSRGDELINIYKDKGSGTKIKNRQGIQQLLKAAHRGEFEKLYIKDISRLCRNTLDFITVLRELTEKGVQLHLLNMGDGKDIDVFTLNLMAMIAEQESQKISERVKFSKNISKDKGIVPNFVYGYDRIDKFTLVKNERESKIVKKIFDLYTEEKWGMARIAKYLYENQIQTKKMQKGHPNYNWSQRTVGILLKNEIYVGKIINGKETMKNIYSYERVKHPEENWNVKLCEDIRMISDEQFDLAQKQMERNASQFAVNLKGIESGATRRSDKHLFSNLIKCGCCGFSYRRVQRKHSNNGKVYRWWTCSKRSAYGSDRCATEFIRIEEDYLIGRISQLLSYLVEDKEAFFRTIENKCNTLIHEYIKNTSDCDFDDIEEQLRDLNQQRDNLITMTQRGIISIDESEIRTKPINTQIEVLSFKLNQTEKTRELTRKVKVNLKQFIKNFEAFNLIDNLDNIALKKIVKEIRVVSEDEIYVCFNVNDDIEGLNFPIKLSDIFGNDTNTLHRT